jgi:prevent-host-death family protein
MTRTISATEARVHFGDVLRGVTERGETILVERGGKPQVVVMSVQEYDRLRNGQEKQDDWWDLVMRAQERFRREWGDRPIPNIERLIEEGRDERDEQILAGLL